MSGRGVNALAARVAHAAVEGTAFVWTKDGFRALLLVNSLALAWALGPRKTVAIGMQCALACSATKFCIVLAGTGSSGGKEHKLDSIWDFDPPGDLGESGAWKVLKELAATMSMGKDSHEELDGLDPLPLQDLVVRLTLLYRHAQAHPAVDELGPGDIDGEPSAADVETLCKYLYLADQAYDCGTEANLKDVLAELGYELNFAKLEATWAEHCPAYFVATHSEEKELVITVRGTAQIEDVVTDLTALPTEMGDTGHLVHGGVLAAAIFLKERLLSLCQAMHAAGYCVTIVGHSLGAGAAVLLGAMLRDAGVRRLRCHAFATPNCADAGLAAACADFATSVVFRDDVVTRFSPEALAGLHRRLLEFDVDAALEEIKDSDNMLLRFVSFLGSRTAASGEAGAEAGSQTSEAGSASGSAGQNGQEGDAEAEDGRREEEVKRARTYRPHIPGRILYIYRRQADGPAAGPEHQLAFVKGTCPALRCIRLSDKVVTDHLIDSYFEGFGRKNPSKERQARLEREKAEKEGDYDSAADGAKEQSAETRDKEAKDKWRPWLAKVGLIS